MITMYTEANLSARHARARCKRRKRRNLTHLVHVTSPFEVLLHGLHDLDVTLSTRCEKRRDTHPIRSVHVRPVHQELVHRVQMPGGGRGAEWRHELVVRLGVKLGVLNKRIYNTKILQLSTCHIRGGNDDWVESESMKCNFNFFQT